MPKDIRNCYIFLNLQVDASIDDVKMRQRALIKMCRAKAIKSGKSCKNKISLINEKAEKLIDYIATHDVKQEKLFKFNTTKQNLFTLLGVFVLVLIYFCANIIIFR